ncbi:Ring zinc finger-like protein, partial [Globisporangium splendens]
MGHTGSVQRRNHSARRNPNGTLYGGPVGAQHGAAAGHHTEYTPAQLQALYLSRGRPDMGFMSNQAMVPKEVPEMQQTRTVKNHVNLKKSTLKLVPTAEHPEKYSLEFQFDATKPCRVLVYLLGLETIDDETGCSTYALQRKDTSVATQEFPEGLAQKFSLEDAVSKSGEDHKQAQKELFDFSAFQASELVYKEGSLRFPLIVVLEVLGSDANPQSQSTFCTFLKNASDAWTVKMLKQKVQVEGLTYELQEIYGIDGSLAAAPKMDNSGNVDGEASGDQKTGGGLDEIDIPDGAECIICMCEPRNTTVLPCRHMCLCSECAEALRKNSSTCPICRTRVEALLQIRVEPKESHDSKE